MRAKIKFLEVEFPDIPITYRDVYKVRGYFADLNTADEYMHNHTADRRRVLYRYPMVQYKKYRGHPFIITFGDAVPSVHRAVMETDEMVIGTERFSAGNIDIRICTKLIGDGAPMTRYRFLSPWLCLNQKNYRRYIAMEPDERQELLKKILIGNILSMCGGFGVTIERHLHADLDVREVNTVYKDVTMIAFVGEFSVNCFLPSMCGLGKGVSRGMGTIQKIGGTEDAGEP